MTTRTPRTYGYTELADRIEAVLGQRPSLSTLRAARTTSDRGQVESRMKPRLTAGMPLPMPSDSPTAPARFLARDVEKWLTKHPILRWVHAADVARERLAAGESEEAVVAAALRDGLSWSLITELINERADATGGPTWAKSGIHKKYRHLEAGA